MVAYQTTTKTTYTTTSSSAPSTAHAYYTTGPMITQYTTSSGGLSRNLLGTRLSVSPMVVSPTVMRVPMLGTPVMSMSGLPVTGGMTVKTVTHGSPTALNYVPVTTAFGVPTLSSDLGLAGVSGISSGVTGVSAPMSIAPMGMATGGMMANQARDAMAMTTGPNYCSDSSFDLNGVHCEGHIEVTHDKITKAKNIFLGTGPFPLSSETLEVTPEMAVMAHHPDIKLHVPDVPSAEHQTLSLQDLRQMLGLSENDKVFLALPGQHAAEVSVSNGVMQFVAHH